jgi:hypothetical protein
LFFLKKFNKIKRNNEWITKGIKISSTPKRDLYLISRNSNNSIIKNHYKKYSQILSDVIKAAKRLHYNNEIINSTNKMKTIWQIVKTETNTTHNFNTPLININGELSHNYQTIVNEFNRYYANTATKILADNSLNNSTNSSSQSLAYLYKVFNNPFPNVSLTPTNTNEIRNIIKKLKTKNSSGYDEISMKALKMSTPYIISPLTYIINKTLAMRTFPLRLKYAQIHPIFKEGDKNDITNYRPISLLTSFSKIFEKVIYIRLYTHFVKNKVFAPE